MYKPKTIILSYPRVSSSSLVENNTTADDTTENNELTSVAQQNQINNQSTTVISALYDALQNTNDVPLSIYNQGVTTLPIDHPHYYKQFKKQDIEGTVFTEDKYDTSSPKHQENTNTTLRQKQMKYIERGIINKSNRLYELSLPYDILNIVFGNLEKLNLLQCIDACATWRNFILNWLGFWEKINSEYSQINISTIDLLIRRKTRLLTKLAVSIPSIRCVEFINCNIPYRRLYGRVLLAFPYATHISIHQEENKKRQPPTVEYMQPLTLSGLLNCHREYIGNGVLKSCPHLLNLVVADNAEIPKTYVSGNNFHDFEDGALSFSNDNDTDDKEEQKTTFAGLLRLIIMGEKFYLQNDTSALLCKHTHKTLELLYLRCRLEPFFGEQAFYQLGKYHWPRLREIHLSTSLTHSASSEKATKVLVKLFSRCPALEAITVNSFSIPGLYRLCVDDSVLDSIARNCHLTRHLHILGDRCHGRYGRYFTTKGALQFSTKGGNRLEDLEMDIPRNILEPLSKI
ncbi:hypothetical protein BDA99DRAFT_603734 [Phascolomyces articulosus]|uniref:F-box domain-containing protein n=1 Tax=Phascolomyces articulosus TaxID=60185 RepID=A0AAD5KE21_9FUNG|nr:hypothetical protein BDA99DRAFT_603734 [Phascolomyces articulosus]